MVTSGCMMRSLKVFLTKIRRMASVKDVQMAALDLTIEMAVLAPTADEAVLAVTIEMAELAKSTPMAFLTSIFSSTVSAMAMLKASDSTHPRSGLLRTPVKALSRRQKSKHFIQKSTQFFQCL